MLINIFHSSFVHFTQSIFLIAIRCGGADAVVPVPAPSPALEGILFLLLINVTITNLFPSAAAHMCEDAVELLLSSALTSPLDQPISPDAGVADAGVGNDRIVTSDGVLVSLPP